VSELYLSGMQVFQIILFIFSLGIEHERAVTLVCIQHFHFIENIAILVQILVSSLPCIMHCFICTKEAGEKSNLESQIDATLTKVVRKS